jgi:hypothetical protein
VVEPQGTAERIVRWSLLDPVGWFLLQVAELFFAGVVGRVVIWVLGGDVASSAQWTLYAVIILSLAVVTYRVRRRYLAEHQEPHDPERETP